MPASFHQGRRFGGNKYHQRQQQKDRPKSKHVIPGCEPWQLVMTKLGRRFVYDPEKNDSFWKFPPHVMKGVVEFDRLEREKKVRGAEQNESKKWKVEDNGAQEADTQNVEVTGAGGDDGDDSEYEEVEVTDEDEDEEGGNPSKRQKTEEEAGDQAMEFNEDDIAYQLAAMGQDYELDPGEYGAGDGEELEEGAEGLELTEEDASDLFKDLLDDFHINPYTPWDKVVEAGQIVEDDRYTVLLNMKSRREVWNDWSREKIRLLKEQRDKEEKKDPRIPYLAFLHTKATPKLYWPEFRRKYMKEPEMRHTKLSDKEREKWYRDYINRKLKNFHLFL